MFGLIPCYFEIFNNLLRTPYFPTSLSPVSCEARYASPHFSTITQTPPGHGLLKDWRLPSCCFPVCVSGLPEKGPETEEEGLCPCIQAHLGSGP